MREGKGVEFYEVVLMGLVTVAMLMLSMGLASITGLSRAVREPSTLNASMLRAMAFDNLDPSIKSAFSAKQLELRCCGVQSYSDWYQHRGTLPPACCGRVWNGKRGEHCDVPLYTNGCLRPALAELRCYVNALSILASAIVVVMGVTLFTAATAYILVTNVVERSEARAFKPAQPLRRGRAGVRRLAGTTLLMYRTISSIKILRNIIIIEEAAGAAAPARRVTPAQFPPVARPLLGPFAAPP
ncbi:uncharacterized protein ACR2FA_004844 [Aphomia sociella]